MSANPLTLEPHFPIFSSSAPDTGAHARATPPRVALFLPNRGGQLMPEPSRLAPGMPRRGLQVVSPMLQIHADIGTCNSSNLKLTNVLYH